MSMTGSRRDSDNLMKHEWTRGHGKPSSESVAGNQEAYRRRVIPCCPWHRSVSIPFFVSVCLCLCRFLEFSCEMSWSGLALHLPAQRYELFLQFVPTQFLESCLFEESKSTFFLLPGSTANSWVLWIQRWGEIGIIHCCEWLEATTRGLYFDNVLSLWF